MSSEAGPKSSHVDFRAWESAKRAFDSGRPSAADVFLRRAVCAWRGGEGVPPGLSRLGTCAQATNSAAIAVAQALRESDATSAALCAAARAESAAASARAMIPPAISPGEVAERAFAAEIATTGAYNATLAAMHAKDFHRARLYGDRGALYVVRIAKLFADAIDEPQSAPSEGRSRKRPRVLSGAMALSGRTERSWNSWFSICSACEALRSWLSPTEGMQDLRHAVRRWADSCGAFFEILGAVHLLSGDRAASLNAVHVSKALRDLGASLASVGVSQTCAARTQDTDEAADDERLDNAECSEESDDIRTDSDECPSTPGIGESDPRIRSGARARCMEALAFASGGEWENALTCVAESGRMALPEPNKSPSYLRGEPGSDDLDLECHWPSAYLAAAVMLRRGDPADRMNAVSILDACTAVGYRSADSCALAARLLSGEDSIAKWQRVLAIEYKRVGALWSVSRVFGALGKNAERANLLRGLEKVLVTQSTHESRSANQSGTSTTGNEPLISLAEEDSLPADVVNETGTALPLVDKVRIELARALLACGEWSDALEVLDDHVANILADVGPLLGRQHVDRVLRDFMWTLACARFGEKIVSSSDLALKKACSGFTRCAILLAVADAHMNAHKYELARSAVLGAFREAELGLVVPAAHRNEFMSDHDVSTTWDGDAQQFLRGVCYNNLGVIRACHGDFEEADASFAASQVAFDKCAANVAETPWRRELMRFAKLHSDATAFNRCLMLWRQGTSEDAISLWASREKIQSTSAIVSDEELDYFVKSENDALENCAKEERVGFANVLGYLSVAQRTSMTVLCVSHRRVRDKRRIIANAVDDIRKRIRVLEDL